MIDHVYNTDTDTLTLIMWGDADECLDAFMSLSESLIEEMGWDGVIAELRKELHPDEVKDILDLMGYFD